MQKIANLSTDQRKLLKIFKGLDKKDQTVLIAFAEFLDKREASIDNDCSVQPSQEPIPLERPAEESVVAAIKRLSSSYHMLDADTLLTETSSLMTAHLIHGRSASDVIDELETMFTREYEAFLAEQEK